MAEIAPSPPSKRKGRPAGNRDGLINAASTAEKSYHAAGDCQPKQVQSRTRAVLVFSVYDGRDWLGDVYESSEGFFSAPAEGRRSGPFRDQKGAAAAVREARTR